MHLAVDALGIKHSGGAMVLLDVLDALLARDDLTRLSLFTSPRATRRFSLPKDPRIVDYPQPAVERYYPLRVHWYLRGLATAVQRIGAQRLLCMAGMGHGGATPHITMIQQALPFSREALQGESPRTRLRMRAIRTLMGASCRRSLRVVAQTPTMREWLCDAFDAPPSKVHVTLPTPRLLNTSDALPAPTAMADTPVDRRLLYVGNTSVYKNVKTLIKAMEIVRGQFVDARLFLTWPEDHRAGRIAGIVPLGYLTGDALAAAYRHATIVVQPSLVESGPLTMIEAMQFATPVAVADRPYAHDICEEAAAFFDPTSAKYCAATLLRLLGSQEAREGLSKKGEELLLRRRQTKPYHEFAELVLRA